MNHKHYWEGKKFTEQLIKAAQDRAAKEGQENPNKILLLKVLNKTGEMSYGLYLRPGDEHKAEFVTWAHDVETGGTFSGNYYSWRPAHSTAEDVCQHYRAALANVRERAGSNRGEATPTRAGVTINFLISDRERELQELREWDTERAEEGRPCIFCGTKVTEEEHKQAIAHFEGLGARVGKDLKAFCLPCAEYQGPKELGK